MGLTWALAWATVGVGIGLLSFLVPGLLDSVVRVFDAPLPALALPGFIGGAAFSLILSVVARGRKFSDLSLPLFAVCGAVGGLLLAQIPIAAVALGLGTPAEGVNMWRLTAIASGPFAVLGAASACLTLLIARKVEDTARSDVSDDIEGLTEGEARELLGTGPATGFRKQKTTERVRRDAGQDA